MSCNQRTEKKYRDRPSPPYSAQECPGMIKRGNNGKLFISKANVKGIYQWKPYQGEDPHKTSRRTSRKKSSRKTKKQRKSSRKSSRKTKESRKSSRKSSRKTKKSRKSSRKLKKSRKTSRKNEKSRKSSRKNGKSPKRQSGDDELVASFPNKSPKLDCSKVVRYRKTIKEGKRIMIKQITGLELKKGYLHPNIGYNNFREEAVKVPPGWKRHKLSKSFVKEFYCDTSREVLTKDNPAVKMQNLKGAKTYFTHDNGGRPFLVAIRKNEVKVYKKPGEGSGYFVNEDDSGEKWTYVINLHTFKPKKVFVGKSPKNKMTEFSGGHGPAFDGNSILVELGKNEYVFIGQNIFKFESYAPITKYVSPVGNSDVPYPFAVDQDGTYYLMIEDVVLKVPSKYANDPYEFYYDAHNITPKPTELDNFQNIKEFRIGGERYTLTYKPNPAADYDRIAKWKDFKDGMSLILTNGKKVKITKKEYIKIINDYGKKMGFKPFKGRKILTKRLW